MGRAVAQPEGRGLIPDGITGIFHWHPSGRTMALGSTQPITAMSFVCLSRESPRWATASSFTRFLDHTQRRTTVGRTPLGEWSTRRRDLYLPTHITLTTNMHAPGGIRTHNLSSRAAIDLRLRPCGHWDRHQQWAPGIFPGGKGGRWVGLTLPPSFVDCLAIWEPQPPGTLRACPGL